MTDLRHPYSGPLSTIWCTSCGKGRAAHETHDEWQDRQAKAHAAAESQANRDFFASRK